MARAAVRCLEQPWVRNIPLGSQGNPTLVLGALTPVWSTCWAALSFGSSKGEDACNRRSTTSSRPRSAVTIRAGGVSAPTTIPRPTRTSDPKATEKRPRRPSFTRFDPCQVVVCSY